MSKMTVDEMLEEVLEIERESITKRKNTVDGDNIRLGRYKEDTDVVRKILTIIDERGIENEN